MQDLNKMYVRAKPSITKELLLKHTTDYEVYCRYIGHTIPIGSVIISPFKRANGKEEKTPSFGLWVKNNEILFNDFVIGGGDFVKFVQIFYNIDNYYKALSKICSDFGLKQYYKCDDDVIKTGLSLFKSIPFRDVMINNKKDTFIYPIKRKWKHHDIMYWNKYGIDLIILNKYKVYPISSFIVNGSKFEAAKWSYAYLEEKEEKTTYKIYQPFMKTYKWITNNDNSVLQGWNQLPKSGEVLIITKSLKDVMVIRKTLKVSAVALQNEQSAMSYSALKELRKRFETIYLLFDNDYNKPYNLGQERAKKLVREYSMYMKIINLLIPSELKSTDISDLYEKHGKKNTIKIISQLMYQN